MAKKKKVYKNPYKEAQGAEASGGQTAGPAKKKLSFKSYFIGVAAIAAIAAYFMQNTAIGALSCAAFIINGFLMGKEQFVFLAIGAALGFFIGLQNDASILISIAIVWALFYIILIIAGMFMSRGKRRS